MKLYHSNASPNSRRVRIFLREKGISMPLLPVDLGAREQFSDAFRAINPRLQVPVLVLDDGTAIAEVPAIWRYLEAARCPARTTMSRFPPWSSAARSVCTTSSPI
jgi:glutathione S-transferase